VFRAYILNMPPVPSANDTDHVGCDPPLGTGHRAVGLSCRIPGEAVADERGENLAGSTDIHRSSRPYRTPSANVAFRESG
jgi:hypothetical protein